MGLDCDIEFCERLQALGISFEQLPDKECWRHQQRWRECYCAGFKSRTGKWSPSRYDWQVFESPDARCLLDDKALLAYGECHCDDAFVIVHGGNRGDGVRCRGETPPDLSSLPDEFYVFPLDLAWTMVFSHEGPIFSRAEWQPDYESPSSP